MPVNKYYSDYELKDIREVLDEISPKNTPENIVDLIPEKIFHSMSKYLRKDLQELLDCYACELWTATCLMAFRIIEREVKKHIYKDLDGPDSLINISECIKHLESTGYNETIIELLKVLRVDRNEGMHGERRFSTVDANYYLTWGIYLPVWIYNQKKQSESLR